MHKNAKYMLQTAAAGDYYFTEAKKYKRNKNYVWLLARFDNSKQTQRIIDLAAQLPNSFTLVVAGFCWSVRFYLKIHCNFWQQAQCHISGSLNKSTNQQFLSWNRCSLYPQTEKVYPWPSLRLLFHVDFITSDVAGCKELAKEFEREAEKRRLHS